MKQFVVVLFLLAIFGPGAARSEELRLESSADAMGSTYSLVLYGEDRARLEMASEEAFDEVRRLDRMLSNYRPESEWSQVNRYAAERPVKVSAELFQLLSACVEYSRQSEGAFDISVGPLMKVWGFYKGSGRLPQKPEVLAALDKVGYRNILLDASNKTVRFAREGVELDPGGIGKGYAVDRMVDVLRRDGIESALVSASGSSIYALGAPPGEAGWKVRIRDPKDEAKTVTEVTLKNESMSTSGNYEKFFWAEGKIYSHIMDPRTGYPSTGMLSASVITPLTLDSEAWTKPYYINGREWAAKHNPKGFRVFLCPDTGEAGTGQTCAWLQ
jgi:thiamine biosynthesis lipoprotein